MGYSAPTTLGGWLALAPTAGLSAQNFAPPSLYASALASTNRNIKASGTPTQSQILECQAFLIMRGIIYWRSVPGDCGNPGASLDFSNVQITKDAGEIASGIAGGIGAIAGAALPGIGIAVQAITQIFAHHDQAVANEQNTICQVAGVMNQVFPYYDSLVRNGQISPGTGVQGVQNFIAQVTAKLQTIYKSCNASCVYISFLQAHSDFLTVYYPAIAPVQYSPHAPGAAPTSITPTAPGGVIRVGNILANGLSAIGLLPSNTIEPAPASSGGVVAASPSNYGALIGIAAIILLLVLVLKAG